SPSLTSFSVSVTENKIKNKKKDEERNTRVYYCILFLLLVSKIT
ncbi:GSCOCG00007694001-RA-CDS, partial [Cotesia congregata]